MITIEWKQVKGGLEHVSLFDLNKITTLKLCWHFVHSFVEWQFSLGLNFCLLHLANLKGTPQFGQREYKAGWWVMVTILINFCFLDRPTNENLNCRGCLVVSMCSLCENGLLTIYSFHATLLPRSGAGCNLP